MTKPLIILDTKYNIVPLMKRVNNPKVRILIGRVMRIMSGLKKALMIPITRATTNTTAALETSIPFTMYETINIAKAFINHLTRKYSI
jgi:hypothetical protein